MKWNRVQSRIGEVAGKCLRFFDGRMHGRPPKRAVNNLLSGMAECAECGGSLIIASSPRKGGRINQYMCSNRRKNRSCENNYRIGVDVLNEAVLQAIEEHALTPEAVESVIALSERDDTAERENALRKELKNTERKIGHLVGLIEEGLFRFYPV